MRVYRRAMAFYRAEWAWILLLCLLIASGVGVGLALPWPMATLTNFLTRGPLDAFPHNITLALLPNGPISIVLGLVVLTFVLKVMLDTLSTMQQMVRSRLEFVGTGRVRGVLFEKLHALSPAYHKSQPQGDAIFRLSHDVFGPWGIVNTFIVTAEAVARLAIMGWIMALTNLPLTLFALSVTPFLVGINVWFGYMIKQKTTEQRRIDTDLTTAMQRSMSAIMLTQAYGREEKQGLQFLWAVRRSIAAWIRLRWRETLHPLATNILFGLGQAMIFGYGGYLVWHDQIYRDPPVDDGMDWGKLTVFSAYCWWLWDPLNQLTSFSARIASSVAATERVFEVLDREVQIRDEPDAGPLQVRPRVLTLEDVVFGYRDTTPVLRGLSCRIEPRQFVAFVGKSGTGKSTLLSLLPRFYDPQSGAVRLDGIDLRSCYLRDVRRHFALVGQDFATLPTTVRENIAFGKETATDSQIHAAAELAGAAEFISQLPDGYNTIVAEGGANLSGGQRQRLAFARALLSDAPIMVLDEPTSALDPAQEMQCIHTLGLLREYRTIIIVTHRLHTVVDCDRIFLLDGGRLIEQGTHEELLARGGKYAAMFLANEGEPEPQLA